jgi:hypothetical protein
MKLFHFLLVLTGLLASNSIRGQQPPFHLKWYRIETPQFRIIFHEGLNAKAQETASLMEYIADKVPAPYQFTPKRVNLYLSSLTATSNAYVTLAPRHIHFYAHPPQNTESLGGSDWFQLLATHEYRHLTQFDYLDRHFFQFPSTLAGDLGKSIMLNLFIPIWYYEGDAIASETTLTCAGRGRLPEFEMPLKAIVTGTDQQFTYNQAYLRSYKRYFPDHYTLGYFMHTHVARNFGTHTWPSVLENTTKMHGFSYSLRKLTGSGTAKTFKNTMNELGELWQESILPLPEDLILLPGQESASFTHFRHGQRLADGTIAAVKYGFDTAPSIIQFSEIGDLQKIRGLNNDLKISTNGNSIVWSSVTPHHRWGMNDYSDILKLNIETEIVKRLTWGQKYLSPAISPNGDRIAAVRYDEKLNYSIVILDAFNGNLISEINWGSKIPRTPSWSSDGKMLIYSLAHLDHTQITISDIENKSTVAYSLFPNENIADPILSQDFIYFISGADGSSSLHALHLPSNERYIALKGGYGFSNPSVSTQGDMIITAYTPDGYRIYSWTPQPVKFQPFALDSETSFYISDVLEKDEFKSIFEENFHNDQQYEVKPYSHLAHGLRLHSWFIMPALQGVMGTAIMSDALQIHNLSATLLYNQNENTALQSVIYSYAGLHPVISAGGSTGNRTVYDDANKDYYHWNEKTLDLEVSYPVNLTREDFNQTIYIASGINYVFISNQQHMAARALWGLGNGSFLSGGALFSWKGYKAMAPRDFYPRMGFSFDAEYKRTLNASDYKGSLVSISLVSYLPGLLPHHSFRITGGWEKQLTPEHYYSYIYSSRLRNFRGYPNYLNIVSAIFSADYSLPLLYPDLGMGSFIYCPRVRGNFFLDMGLTRNFNYTQRPGSFGADLLFDVHLFRIPVEIDLGVRWVRSFEKKENVELIFFQRF